MKPKSVTTDMHHVVCHVDGLLSVYRQDELTTTLHQKEESVEDGFWSEEQEIHSRPILWIINDMKDECNYLKICLEKDFIVKVIKNISTLNASLHQAPDLIIIDHCTYNIGNFLALTQHHDQMRCVPLIVLTSDVSESHYLDLLRYGATDCFVRPFSVPTLLAKVSNLLSLKGKMQAKSSQPQKENGFSNKPVSFVDQATDLVEKNISHFDLGVEKLAWELGVSQASLYRKLQGSVSVSPNQFIRNIRLKKAAQLLRMQQHTVMEVAYMVGFRDPKYFSKAFKKHFSESPTCYQRKAINK